MHRFKKGTTVQVRPDGTALADKRGVVIGQRQDVVIVNLDGFDRYLMFIADELQAL